MKKIIVKILKNWKSLFCYGFIILGLMLFVIVLIKQPMKKIMTPLNNDEVETKIQEVTFPIKQKINVNVNYLTGLWLYMEDSSINNYQYEITVTDSENNKLFYHNYADYKSNIFYLHLGTIKNSKNKELYLNINCGDCNNVKMALTKDDDLKISEESYIKNNTYNWYIVMSISIGLVLLPLAKEEDNE